MSKIRVLIVDDSAYSRQTIKKMLESDPHVEVAGVAADGIDAMAKTLRLKPDVITLDIEMPEMDGFSFLRWLMKNRPTPVIIVSSYSDSKTVFRALEFGAADFIAKPPRMPSAEFEKLEKDLARKVKGVKDVRLDKMSRNLELLEAVEIQRPSLEKTSIQYRRSRNRIINRRPRCPENYPDKASGQFPRSNCGKPAYAEGIYRIIR